MSLKIGLLGKKLGMTQVFAEDGESIPVTVIQTGPNHVIGLRTQERDGYTALVLGFDEKPVRLANKAELGAVKESGLKPQRFIREIRPQLVSSELEIAPLLDMGGEHRVPPVLWEQLRANFAA